jgi:uncharacterized protein (TIGR02466 family)
MSSNFDYDGDASIELMFPTPVYRFKIKNAEHLNAPLEDIILAMEADERAARPDYQDVYPNGYTSYYSNKTLMDDVRFKAIAGIISFEIANFAGQYGFDTDILFPRLEDMWTNIQYRGGSHPKHNHQNSHFSGVYYVAAPEQSSQIRFHDPKRMARMAEPKLNPPNPLNHLDAEFDAEAGLLIVFPSYLEHDVTVHHSDEPRISMSFNARMVQLPSLAP